MSDLAERIVAEIRDTSDPEREAQLRRYFREPVETHGLTSQQSKDIARKYYPEVKGDLDAAMSLTEELMSRRNLSYSSVALRMLERFSRQLEPSHFPVFDGWVEYLTNWATTCINTSARCLCYMVQAV